MASEAAQTRRKAAASPRTTRARRSVSQPSRRPRSAAATSTHAIAASASVTSTDVDPTPSDALGWYVAWRKRNGTAAARTSASVAASPASVRTIPVAGVARGSGSAVTRRTVARATAAPTLTPHDGSERSPAPVCDRSRALPLGGPRHPRHDRRRPDARPRGLRALRDGDGGRRPCADAPRSHRRGEPHEVRLPVRRRRGLGEAAPSLPARARGQARGRRARARS